MSASTSRTRTCCPSGIVVLTKYAIEGRVTGPALPLGQQVRVRLVEADIAKRTVAFELVG